MTLPPLNVWITHDGSAECPLPVGTVHDFEYRETDVGWCNVMVRPYEQWNAVHRYRVISYPEETNDVATD